MDEIRSHPFETMGNHEVWWYLQGNHHSNVSQVVQDFVHPQQVKLLVGEMERTQPLDQQKQLKHLCGTI